MKSLRMRSVLALTSIAAIGLLTACGSGGPESPDPNGTADETTSTADEPLTLKVVGLAPGSEQSAIDAFDAKTEQFEAANPDINIEAQEYDWSAAGFATALAGGTLPDVFQVPFTDGKTLIENGQIADIDALVRALPYGDKFNENVLAAGQSEDGTIYAVPYESYAMGLQYNRTLFTQAGLDPDKPPTTWDEVRAAAKQIADQTGQAGYAMMTQSNAGGWQLTAASYARGGRMESIEDGKATATVDNAGTKAALEYIKALRWEDNSMGSNFLFDWGSINQAFAAGQIGMYTGGSDLFGPLTSSNALNPDDYGLTVIPIEGEDAGVLGGGALAAVNAKAEEAVKEAAVRWIDFFYIQPLIDKDAAVQKAETHSEAGDPVGVPALPLFDRETYEESRTWIQDYINVPQDQVKFFTDQIFDMPVVAEPSRSTQEMYAMLDPVVQAVLTDQNADIDALLAEANAEVQALLDKS